MPSGGGENGANRAVGVTEWVYARLRQAILEGEFSPGERMRQSAVAERFEVSQTPVREALARLASDGLIELQPRRGAVVNSLSPREIEEIYELRRVLDPYVARRAAAEASEEELRNIADAAEDCAEAGLDATELFDRNRKFHRAIYEACGNTRMIQLFETLWDSVTAIRMFEVYVSDPEELKRMNAEHAEITNALLERDAAAAERLVREHIGDARRDLLGLLERTTTQTATEES